MTGAEPVWDVLVAGAGPAGTTAATLLARAGHRVLLCDQSWFPRHKTCGEYFPPAAAALFDRLGVLPAVEALAPRRHAGMAVVAPDGSVVLGRYGDAGRGLSLRRRDLDGVLVDHARASGAVVRQGCRVADLRRLRDGSFEVALAGGATARARAVLGADGRNSLVARRLGLRRRETRHRRWAVMGHFRGVRGPSDHGEMIVTPYGYCGINPLPRGLANVCVVVDPARHGGRLPGGARLAAFFRERIAEHPLTRRRLEDATLEERLWATGPMACRSAGDAADGALLVGDAARFYDPFTGEGMAMALQGAFLASDVLSAALRAGDVSAAALRSYAVRRRKAFSARLRLDRLLQGILARPRLASWVARRLVRDPSLADLMARVLGDTVDARAVLGPRFVARLLRA